MASDDPTATGDAHAFATADGGDRGADGADLPDVDPTRYELAGELSRGGLGMIVRGRDRHLDRTVAIKQMLAHNPRLEARFRREARITARLQHPGIVPIYEAGRWPSGEPFYAMKLVSGRTLKEELAGASGLDARLALVPRLLAVCDAVAYAHSQRVIHRDLKPSNIMIGPFGEVLVVDWGLAKDLDAPADADALPVVASDAEPGLTVSGSVLGTPPYLAPEQARGEAVDERADVYALGAILYEALAGRMPHAGERDDATRTDGATRTIERVIAGPPAAIAGVEPGLPPDVIAIVEKAMARAAGDRYRDAGEVAADLRRFQTGQLVSAHRYSRGLLLARWVRRNRRVVAVGAAAIAAIAVIATVSVRRVVRERDSARRAGVAAERARADAVASGAVSERRTGELLLMEAEHWLDADPTVAMAWLRRHAGSASPAWPRVQVLAVDAASRGVARELVRGLVDPRVGPGGAVIAVSSATHRLVWWRAGQAPVELGDPLPHPTGLAVSSDGARVAYTGAGGVEVLEVGSGAHRVVAPAPVPASALAFGGDGTLYVGDVAGGLRAVGADGVRDVGAHRGTIDDIIVIGAGEIVTTSADGEVRLWSTAGGGVKVLSADGRPNAIAFAAGRVAWASAAVHVLEVASGAVRTIAVERPHTTAVALSSDGRWLASGGDDGVIRIDDLAGGGEVRRLERHTDWVVGLAFSADGRLLASAQARGGPVLVSDLVTGDVRALRGHEATPAAMAWSGDRELVTIDKSGQGRRWPIATPPEAIVTSKAAEYPEIAAVRGGIVAATKDAVRMWATSGEVTGFPGVPAIATRIAVSSDGDRVAFGDDAGVVWRWDVVSGNIDALHGHVGAVRDVGFARDGTLVSCGADHAVRVWDAAGHARVLEAKSELSWVVAIDAEHVAAAGDDGVQVWDVVSGKSRSVPLGADALALAIADDGTIAAAGANGQVIVRRTDGTFIPLPGHRGGVEALAFAPGAATLASGGGDGTVRLWDLATGEARVLAHPGNVHALAFIGPGRLASAVSDAPGGDGTVRIWDVTSGALVAVLAGHHGGVYAIAAAPDGSWLASSGSEDHTVRRWPIDAAAPATPSEAWLGTITSVVLGDGDVARSY